VNRRQALGVLVAMTVVAVGRLVRRMLILGSGGSWREPGWLAEHLPPLPVEETPPEQRRRVLTAPLDPNVCSPDSLELLPGIGPALAGRIAAARARGVHFACARDLQEIRGIGPRLTERLSPYLIFGAADSTDSGVKQSASQSTR
jgi:DNA uptake protein ComE-like DNA-binding protein